MNETNIIEITAEGLRYRDENGDEQFIDFEACYQKFLEKWNDPEVIKRFKELNASRSDAWLENWLEEHRLVKEIGCRDFSVPYIEFYTVPPTTFEFSGYEEFKKVVALLGDAEWVTFDRA